MKRYIWILMLLCFTLLAACSNDNIQNEESDENAEEQTKLKVYTTVYPLSYFTERIGGEFVEVESVYPPGANEHSFEPTQQDMIKFAEADLLFYIGLGLESFIDHAQETLKNENVEFIATTANVPEEKFSMSTGHSHDEHSEEAEDAHTEEHTDEEGTSESEDEHASHAEDGHEEHNEDELASHTEESHEGHNEIDAHVWLSAAISSDLAFSIKDALTEKMPDQAETFETNYQALVQELEALDGQFKDMVAQADSQTFFVSHAAFGYIAGEYDLQQVPIAGLNSQNEPSQKELTEIVALANELNIKYILFEQNVSSKLAETIQSEIGAEALTLHNLSVLTEEDIANNETYFTLMEQNIETLSKALENK
ncbi:metal ABC transporter solute-binding protein, Zn/Mn family [Lysinibacillus antri]|nr:zinc ABC transporter substrate-binding protein [Lysinibacillus antri]